MSCHFIFLQLLKLQLLLAAAAASWGAKRGANKTQRHVLTCRHRRHEQHLYDQQSTRESSDDQGHMSLGSRDTNQ